MCQFNDKYKLVKMFARKVGPVVHLRKSHFSTEPESDSPCTGIHTRKQDCRGFCRSRMC